MDKKRLTSENGKPIADNQNIQTAGVRGPAMLQDVWYLEKLAHFDREVIPERRMHAKGSGAFGTFTVTHDITKYTRASIFSQVGKKTDCLVRFSTVAGERGAADAERDIRGFAMKFYTDTGNWDLVGNNTPVFFLRDPLKFPDLNHAIKRDPRTGMRSANNNWDFWTLLPEALHQVTITMSPRGIPASFRHMHGFGSHTFSFYDKDNKRTWVKFHFRTLQGIKNLTDAEAEAVIAKDRESNQRDLFEAIERGDYPRWLMQVLNVLINLLRSIPFLILMIMVFPLSRLLIGTAVGTTATIVPLVAAAFPFVARLVESSLREVDGNIIEAAQSMGATPMQIICKVMIPESVPSLIQNVTIALTTILGYSAMSGIIGGGGLGKIAIDYGYYRYKYLVMLVAVVILVLLVQVFQSLGTWLSKKCDKRLKQ